MPVNGVAQLQILSRDLTGQESSNTIHLVDESESSPPDLGLLKGIADDFVAIFKTPYLQLLATTSQMIGVITRQQRDIRLGKADVVQQYEHALSDAGTRSVPTPTLPREVCALISFKSVVASRRFRSHNFLPPTFTMNAVGGDSFAGLPDATWIAMQAWVTFLKTGLADAPTRWTGTTLNKYSICCYSNKQELESAPSVALVSDIVLSNRVRWLRSRNKGST